MIRILQISNQGQLRNIMREIGVDDYGIGIMLPKAIQYLLRVNRVPNINANILKQEMLSLGADAAVARGSLTGKVKKTDCLLIGNLSQYNRLLLKLNKQPFGLSRLSEDLGLSLNNYQKENFILDLGKYRLDLSKRTHIMGIVNVTPDSFSGDGLHNNAEIVSFARGLLNDGADIIDIGGESSRPGARPVPAKEEIKRVAPAIKELAKKIRTPISVDTYKPEVARAALDNGASIVNDITGLRNPKMLKVIKSYNAGVVIMHMKGMPRSMQKRPEYSSLIDEIIDYLANALRRAEDAGIDEKKIIVDPGIGFGKLLEHNLKILKRLREFKVLGKPILVGTSRKSFIGKILKVPCDERLPGSISSSVLAAKNGAQIIRAHDVKGVKQALKIFDAIDNS